MAVKITSFEAENVKRVKAVQLSPAADGLTVIGGRNNQGKTSVLDAIAWALAGNKRRPSAAKRDGAAGEPFMKVELSNGLVVERKGEAGRLKVTDPAGGKSGQALLDGFVEQLALDLPRFMAMGDAQKADELLKIIGVGDELAELEAKEEADYNRRLAIGQMAKQKRGAADELPSYPDAPSEPVSAYELIREQQEMLTRNGENQRKRQEASRIERGLAAAQEELKRLEARADELRGKWQEALGSCDAQAILIGGLERDLETARKTAEQLRDESTAEIEASIAAVDEVNAKVRANAAKAAAEAEASELEGQYDDLTAAIERTRADKRRLLEGAGMPLPGLSVDAGRLAYNGRLWDSMSGSDQLKVATAIVRKLKPDCGFVLVDKLEQMDPQTLAEFGAWCEAEGLQVIGTRVGTGDECSIVIEDGTALQGADAAGRAAEPVPEAIRPVPAVEGKWVM